MNIIESFLSCSGYNPLFYILLIFLSDEAIITYIASHFRTNRYSVVCWFIFQNRAPIIWLIFIAWKCAHDIWLVWVEANCIGAVGSIPASIEALVQRAGCAISRSCRRHQSIEDWWVQLECDSFQNSNITLDLRYSFQSPAFHLSGFHPWKLF